MAFANAAGFAVRIDRFGYTGTVTRYNSLADAQSGINAVDTYTINNRDLALRVYDNFSQAGSDRTIIMGSLWYTTDSSGIAGYGNVRGNSGRGFLQMYDLGSLTVTNQFGTFGAFDGTYYTTFNLNVVGSSAGAGQYSRFWIDYQGGGADKVFYHNLLPQPDRDRPPRRPERLPDRIEQPPDRRYRNLLRHFRERQHDLSG